MTTLGYYLRLCAPESFFAATCEEGNDIETCIESQQQQSYDEMMAQVSLAVRISPMDWLLYRLSQVPSQSFN